MRLSSEFIRLPLNFDVDRLVLEATQFSEQDWDYHPLGYKGNTALSLVSSGGDATNSTSGAMAPTSALARTPYIKQIMASLGTVIGRSRFMRLAANSDVPAHSDTDYAWRNRVRIHIPIITDPSIMFSSLASDSKARVDVHMQAGEAWIFDNWREHTVTNPSDVRRIHLVIDTVGTAEFWALAKQGWDPKSDLSTWRPNLAYVAFSRDSEAPELAFENYNAMPVRGPDGVEILCNEFLSEVSHLKAKAPAHYAALESSIEGFCQDWRGHWSLYWCLPEHIHNYQTLVNNLKPQLKSKLLNVALQSNRVDAYSVISNWLDHTISENVSLSELTDGQAPALNSPKVKHTLTPHFEQPIFIISAPRAGATMLFEALKTNKLLWSVGGENNASFEAVESLSLATHKFYSHVLTQDDLSEVSAQQLKGAIASQLRNASGISYFDLPNSDLPNIDLPNVDLPKLQKNSAVRFIDNTLNNALRIPFLHALFPDAKFVLVYRDVNAQISSLIDAWKSQRYSTQLINESEWSFSLVEDWRKLVDQKNEVKAATQWARIIETVVNDLQSVQDSTLFVSYESLSNEPAIALKRVCDFCDIPFGPKMQQYGQTGFDLSKPTLSLPSEDKWRKHETALQTLKHVYQPAKNALDEFVAGK